MTHPQLERKHLEALVVARAIVAPDPAEILERLDRAIVSPAVFALVEQLLDDSDPVVWFRTKGQADLAARAESLSLRELLEYPLETLLGLVNGLPARPLQAPAWERDLSVGLDQETAA